MVLTQQTRSCTDPPKWHFRRFSESGNADSHSSSSHITTGSCDTPTRGVVEKYDEENDRATKNRRGSHVGEVPSQYATFKPYDSSPSQSQRRSGTDGPLNDRSPGFVRRRSSYKRLLRAPQAAVRVAVHGEKSMPSMPQHQPAVVVVLPDTCTTTSIVLREGYLTIKDDNIFDINGSGSDNTHTTTVSSCDALTNLPKNTKLWFQFVRSDTGCDLFIRMSASGSILQQVSPINIESVTHLRDNSNSFFLRCTNSPILWLEADTPSDFRRWIQFATQFVKGAERGNVLRCGRSEPFRKPLKTMPSFKSMTKGFQTEDDLTDVELVLMTPKEDSSSNDIKGDREQEAARNKNNRWNCWTFIFNRCFQKKQELQYECNVIRENLPPRQGCTINNTCTTPDNTTCNAMNLQDRKN